MTDGLKNEIKAQSGKGRESAPAKTIECDVCVIGAGSGGLSVAYGTAQLGRKTVLIEGHKMGGDCLNYGCVPSKSLIAAAKMAHAPKQAEKFGVHLGEAKVDFRAVHDHVHGVIAAIEPHDSVERYEGLGATVITEKACFTGERTLIAGDKQIKATHVVIATGSVPFVPPIAGLENVPYLTNETLFDLTKAPAHLVIIGGGPIGMEMAQAHRRLGSDVTVIEAGEVLGRDDRDLAAVVKQSMEEDGVRFEEGAKVASVSRQGEGIAVTAERDGKSFEIAGSHLLVAVGRRANTDGLGLEAAGVETEKGSIRTDDYMRTTAKNVWAVGDCTGGLQFTHVAGYHASLVVRNMLFKLSKAKNEAIRKSPRVTYTDPELAQVGMTEAQAREAGISYEIARFDYHESDRAQAERSTRGFAKAVVGKGGKILGAGLVGKGAGDLIGPWAMAVSEGLKLTAFTSMIAPYPTLTEVSKRTASAYYAPKLFSKRTKTLLSVLSVFD